MNQGHVGTDVLFTERIFGRLATPTCRTLTPPIGRALLIFPHPNFHFKTFTNSLLSHQLLPLQSLRSRFLTHIPIFILLIPSSSPYRIFALRCQAFALIVGLTVCLLITHSSIHRQAFVFITISAFYCPHIRFSASLPRCLRGSSPLETINSVFSIPETIYALPLHREDSS